MDIDAILDKHVAPPCQASIHLQTPEQQALLRRAREREQQGVGNPTYVKLAELCGVSETSVRRFMRSGCACDS